MKISTLKNLVANPDLYNWEKGQNKAIDEAFQGETGKGWLEAKRKIHRFINTGIPEYSVFATSGNSKLPFLSFSTLPGITCPGASECLSWCYSYKAFRYPAAFARMLQNTLLMIDGRGNIESEFNKVVNSAKFKNQKSIDFRIYVDGDYKHLNDLIFWMELLKDNPKIKGYGYSKSLHLFLKYNEIADFPDNYLLNVSTGGKFDNNQTVKNAIKQLPIYRGEFRTVDIADNFNHSTRGNSDYKNMIRENMNGEKVFPCPGNCGNCTTHGHACGSPKFKGVTIAVDQH